MEQCCGSRLLNRRCNQDRGLRVGQGSSQDRGLRVGQRSSQDRGLRVGRGFSRDRGLRVVNLAARRESRRSSRFFRPGLSCNRTEVSNCRMARVCPLRTQARSYLARGRLVLTCRLVLKARAAEAPRLPNRSRPI
ncbi:MAG TPA: hypothetical protein VGK74_10170 [Symbiobacteriaceae bacterium]